METFTYETATIEDTLQLSGLLAFLFEQEEDFTPDHEKQMRGLRLVIEHPESGRILVVRSVRESGSETVGMVNLLFTASTAEGGRAVLLEDFVIHPRHRGKGLGSELLRHAVRFCTENDFVRITLLTDRTNIRAQRFYERHGFRLSAMTSMRLRLAQLNVGLEKE